MRVVWLLLEGTVKRTKLINNSQFFILFFHLYQEISIVDNKYLLGYA